MAQGGLAKAEQTTVEYGDGVLRIEASAENQIDGMLTRGVSRTLLEEVTYVELSDRPDFNDRFVDQLSFPI